MIEQTVSIPVLAPELQLSSYNIIGFKGLYSGSRTKPVGVSILACLVEREQSKVCVTTAHYVDSRQVMRYSLSKLTIVIGYKAFLTLNVHDYIPCI